jgi:hypothetical protein
MTEIKLSVTWLVQQLASLPAISMKCIQVDGVYQGWPMFCNNTTACANHAAQ